MVVSFGDYHGGNRLRGCVFAYQYIGYSGYDDRCVGGASCFLPEKKIAIADIEALESTVMPVSSYALSLDRLIIWSNGKPWMLISPTNRADFIKQLRKINPNIQLK